MLSVLISLLDDASLPACQSAAAHVLFRMAAAPTSEAERDAIGQSITNAGEALPSECLDAGAACTMHCVCAAPHFSPADLRYGAAGAVESLVSLLKAADPACKEAGALALCRLAWTSSNVRDEIFTKMCGASARDTGVSTVVAPLGPLLEGGQASLWQAAAYLAHAVTQVRNPASLARAEMLVLTISAYSCGIQTDFGQLQICAGCASTVGPSPELWKCAKCHPSPVQHLGAVCRYSPVLRSFTCSCQPASLQEQRGEHCSEPGAATQQLRTLCTRTGDSAAVGTRSVIDALLLLLLLMEV